VSELLASLAGLTSRRLDPLQALAGSVVALLVARPAWVLDLGFALSCAATLGLVTFGEAAAHVRGRLGPLARSLLASLGAQLLALPLVTSSFHLLPWIGPAANLVAVPIGGLLLSAAWIALLVDLAAPGFGATLFHAVDALAAALRVVTHLPRVCPARHARRSTIRRSRCWRHSAPDCSRSPARAARRRPPSAPRLATSRGRRSRGRRARARGAARAGGCARAAAACRRVLDRGARRRAGRCDGDRHARRAGGSSTRGPARSGRMRAAPVVLPFLRWAGVRRLEGLVVTHDDSDHTGGVATVLGEIPASRVVASPAREGARGPASRFAADTVSPASCSRPRRRSSCAGHRAIQAHGSCRTASPADNANGVVLEVGSRRGRALLLADVDSTTEALLAIASPVALLKVGHHGASQSSGAAFLARMRPRVALVSCGRRNRFGHPDPGVLARLAAVDARVLRTDAMGAVWCELTAAGVRVLDGRHAPDVARRAIVRAAARAAAVAAAGVRIARSRANCTAHGESPVQDPPFSCAPARFRLWHRGCLLRRTLPIMRPPVTASVPVQPPGVASERGVALLAVLGFLILMALIAGGLLLTVNSDRRLVVQSMGDGQALNLAEAGVAEAMERIRTGEIPSTPNPRMVGQIYLCAPGQVPASGADTIGLATWQSPAAGCSTRHRGRAPTRSPCGSRPMRRVAASTASTRRARPPCRRSRGTRSSS
jgi:beta-lactamase superfamily II metal-dependent hydrolase